MIKVLEEKPVPRETVNCGNCGSLLEYGNADLMEYNNWGDNPNYAYSVPRHHFQCPVCGCWVRVNWIVKGE